MLHTIPAAAVFCWTKKKLWASEPPTKPNIVFSLAQDISETNNVAAAHPDRVKEMTGLLQRIRENGRSRP
jgi:hypothetical protein